MSNRQSQHSRLFYSTFIGLSVDFVSKKPFIFPSKFYFKQINIETVNFITLSRNMFSMIFLFLAPTSPIKFTPNYGAGHATNETRILEWIKTVCRETSMNIETFVREVDRVVDTVTERMIWHNFGGDEKWCTDVKQTTFDST